MRNGLLVIAGWLVVSGCQSRLLDAPPAPCSTSGDLGAVGVVGPAGDMGAAAIDGGSDAGGTTPPAGDMTPPLESYIRCRGDGGAPQWLMPVGPVQTWAGDILDVTTDNEGVITSRIERDNVPGGQADRGRLQGFFSGGELMDVGEGYLDWTLGGPGWLDIVALAGSDYGFAIGLGVDGGDSVYLGGKAPIPITGSSDPLLATYNFSGALQWVAHLGNLPISVMALDANGNVAGAGLLQGDATPYTVDVGLGAPIAVGSNDLIVVGRFDATGKLTAVSTFDTGGSAFGTGATRGYVRSAAIDGKGDLWVTFYALVNTPMLSEHAGLAVFPADGSPATGRSFATLPFLSDAFVGGSANGHVALAYVNADEELALEVWTDASTRVWQRASTGVAYFSVSGIAVDDAGEVAVAGRVFPPPNNAAAGLSPDLGGGPLVEGWMPQTPYVGYGFVAKYAGDGTPRWSKLRVDDDDGFITEPPFGRRIAEDASGGVYVFTRATPFELCGATVSSTTSGSNLRYITRLAP